MKIAREVEDFAAKQNASADTFLAADASLNAERNHSTEPKDGEAGTDLTAPEAGMAEMSEEFRGNGGEIYLPAAE